MIFYFDLFQLASRQVSLSKHHLTLSIRYGIRFHNGLISPPGTGFPALSSYKDILIFHLSTNFHEDLTQFCRLIISVEPRTEKTIQHDKNDAPRLYIFIYARTRETLKCACFSPYPPKEFSSPHKGKYHIDVCHKAISLHQNRPEEKPTDICPANRKQ